MRKNRDKIEFYKNNKLVAVVNSSIIPPVGSYINIRKETWLVNDVSFSLDDSDDPYLCGMRCNVNLEKTP